MPKSKKPDLGKLVDFFFEAGQLAKTPRSGFIFLDERIRQSVAEHTNRVIFLGYAMASVIPNINISKVMQMCLFHDLAEARVSDLNYMNQKYVKRFEDKARKDLARIIPFGKEMLLIIDEFEKSETMEAKIVRDADQLDLLLVLKEQLDLGNKKVPKWIRSLLPRLKTDVGKNIAKKILETHSDRWWFGDEEDTSWIEPAKL